MNLLTMNLLTLVTTPPLQPTTDCRPTARHLAVALASLEWEKHQRTRPIEYIAHAANQALYSPNLSTVISHYESVERWVRSCVLDEGFGRGVKGLEKRSEMMQFLVETAKVFRALQTYQARSSLTTPHIQECWRVHNFSSLCAIMSALKSETVTRLTLTHSHMPHDAQKKHGKLARLLDFDAYKRALNGELMQCIPWHGAQVNL